jgi:hypothetical protein
MEILFFLEPAAYALLWISAIAIIAGVITLIIGNTLRYADKNNNGIIIARKGKQILVSGVIAIVLSAPLSCPFKIYKKILIYRGIESETAEKLVENINTLLDISNKKIREWGDKVEKDPNVKHNTESN